MITDSNIALAYDFETNGLVNWHEPSESPGQPHIVQAGAVLVDLTTRKRLASMEVIVRPDGWTIPDEVVAIHGITTEKAMDIGVPEKTAIDMLWNLWGGRQRIGYNESFDARIMRIGLKRYEMFDAEEWKAAQTSCAMRLAQPILRMSKFPKLTEAYKHFTGKPLEGAHGAMADTQACLDVWFAIKDLAAKTPA